MPRLITSLDLGSSSIKAAACTVERSGKISFLSAANVPSKGVQSGNVIDFDAASKDIYDVLDRLEKVVRRRIRSVSATLSGTGIEAIEGYGMIPLGRKPRQVTRQDVKACVKVAGMLKLPLDRQLVGEAINTFYTNENEPAANPIGVHATKLGVKLFLISAEAEKVKNLNKVIESTGRIVENIVASPVAMAEAIFTDRHRVGLTALLDIGSHTTGTALFENESVKEINCVRQGAKWLDSREAITAYLNAARRMFREHNFKNVVITGGGALEEDMIETAEAVFNAPCELGRVRSKWCSLSPSESLIHTGTIGLVNFEAKRILSGYQLENPFIKVKYFINDILDEYF